MALAPEPVKQTLMQEVEGVPLQATTVDNWDQIQSFEAKQDDLLICTYPKSGRWLCGAGSTELTPLSQQELLRKIIIPSDGKPAPYCCQTGSVGMGGNP